MHSPAEAYGGFNQQFNDNECVLDYDSHDKRQEEVS